MSMCTTGLGLVPKDNEDCDFEAKNQVVPSVQSTTGEQFRTAVTEPMTRDEAIG
jgi:hypothetical protein